MWGKNVCSCRFPENVYKFNNVSNSLPIDFTIIDFLVIFITYYVCSITWKLTGNGFSCNAHLKRSRLDRIHRIRRS